MIKLKVVTGGFLVFVFAVYELIEKGVGIFKLSGELQQFWQQHLSGLSMYALGFLALGVLLTVLGFLPQIVQNSETHAGDSSIKTGDRSVVNTGSITNSSISTGERKSD